MTRQNDENTESHCSKCEYEQLQALYRLNTLAKEYAESAHESYERGMKMNARIHSQRKKALYGLKRAILGDYIETGCVDTICTHEIDDRTYYCVCVGEFSFHTPATEWRSPPRGAPSSPTELESFDADPSNRPTELREREALGRLTDEFESPNHHIESPFTNTNYGGRFVGWSSLPGALEEGDSVPERHLSDRCGEGDFIFEIGDTFQTSRGTCEIRDRYHAYLTPWMDRSPLLQRTAYDVLLDGDTFECIRKRRIVDDWWILAESIANPVPNVDGPLSDHAGTAAGQAMEDSIEFEIGDIIELQPRSKADPPIYCQLTEVHVSGILLIGQYEPVPPTDEAPLGLCIEEIADDVVAVHDEPPAQG